MRATATLVAALAVVVSLVGIGQAAAAEDGQGQGRDRGGGDLREDSPPQSLLDLVKSVPYLSEFAKMLESQGLHRAYLDRQITLFAPADHAVRKWKYRRKHAERYHLSEVGSENLVLNHMVNLALTLRQLSPSSSASSGRGSSTESSGAPPLSSLVTGGPPVWVTRHNHILPSTVRLAPPGGESGQELFSNGTGVFVNQAEIVIADLRARSSNGDEQVLHVVDSVMEPLTPISLRQAEYFIGLDARKLLSKSTLYDLGGHSTRIFHQAAQTNRRDGMFSVPGSHTFFLPVDSAFDVSVFRSGYRYDDRNRGFSIPGQSSLDTVVNSSPKVRKELVDQKVVEGHIVPHRLIFTSQAPSGEFQTVAWTREGFQVNVSLQIATEQDGLGGGGGGFGGGVNGQDRDGVLGLDQSFVFNAYQEEDHLPEDKSYDEPGQLRKVVVRSNTITGDRTHSRGMVVSRVVRGNIPVANGVVHLIERPLMIVARSLFEYLMEEGRQSGNRLSEFARLVRDKGGAFAETLLEAKDGTLLVPNNEAMAKVDKERLDYMMGIDYLRAELFGLHYIRERVLSTDFKITANGDSVYSAPAAFAQNRVWFHNSRYGGSLTVAARGVNASAAESDIGTVNGVIHVIDRVLGVPYLTVGQYMESDPNMSHMWSLLKQFRMDAALLDPRSPAKFTVVVPSNAAWEKAQLDFSEAYSTIVNGNFPQYALTILQRHIKEDDRLMVFEELVELSRKSPRRKIDMAVGALQFTQVGEFDLNAYKDNYVALNDEVRGAVVRPNIECTNGYIHLVDTVMIDDAPAWSLAVASSAEDGSSRLTTWPLAAVLAILRLYPVLLQEA